MSELVDRCWRHVLCFRFSTTHVFQIIGKDARKYTCNKSKVQTRFIVSILDETARIFRSVHIELDQKGYFQLK